MRAHCVKGSWSRASGSREMKEEGMYGLYGLKETGVVAGDCEGDGINVMYVGVRVGVERVGIFSVTRWGSENVGRT
jgi:hypothetical protein